MQVPWRVLSDTIAYHAKFQAQVGPPFYGQPFASSVDHNGIEFSLAAEIQRAAVVAAGAGFDESPLLRLLAPMDDPIAAARDACLVIDRLAVRVLAESCGVEETEPVPPKKQTAANKAFTTNHATPGRKRLDAPDDQRIYEAWKTGIYPTFVDLAREFGIRAKQVEKIVDRFRKRERRATE